MTDRLPLPIAVAWNGSVSLSTVLPEEFGSALSSSDPIWIEYDSATQLQSWDFRYWTATPNPTLVTSNGTPLAADSAVEVLPSALSQTVLTGGNQIADNIYIDCP